MNNWKKNLSCLGKGQSRGEDYLQGKMVARKTDYMAGAEGFQPAMDFLLQAWSYERETSRERRQDLGYGWLVEQLVVVNVQEE